MNLFTKLNFWLDLITTTNFQAPFVSQRHRTVTFDFTNNADSCKSLGTPGFCIEICEYKESKTREELAICTLFNKKVSNFQFLDLFQAYIISSIIKWQDDVVFVSSLWKTNCFGKSCLYLILETQLFCIFKTRFLQTKQRNSSNNHWPFF